MLFLPQIGTVPADDKRRGVILVIVIALLALFAAVGLSFVFYAESEATSSKYDNQAVTQDKADIDPELLMAYFLGQFLTDTDNTQSAMRGHSLGRSMHGYNPNDFNTTPFNGIGRLRYTDASGVDNSVLVNYQVFAADGFERTPEFYGRKGDPTYRFLGGANVPWTSPDGDNMFLAAQNADGELLVPSFHRPWIASTPGVPANMQKYLVLYPHASYHPKFPQSEEGAGAPHVKCLDWGKGLKKPGGGYYNNDAYWMDLGFQVMTAPNGKRYKPLFAAVVVDLDGKVNLNAGGNIRGLDATGKTTIHASNHGVGAHEINLSRVLDPTKIDPATNQPEWVNLFRGNATIGVRGRYGPDGQPTTAGSSMQPTAPGTDGRVWFYSCFDLDSVQDGSDDPKNAYRISTKYVMPGEGTQPVFVVFPTYPPQSYSNGAGGTGALKDVFERTNHPLLYSSIKPLADDRVFGASSMEALLRYGGTGSPALSSPLFRLSPLNFGDPTDPAGSARRRRLVTTHSFDLPAPGARAWLYPTATPTFAMGAGAYPTGGAVGTPLFTTGPGGEFATDWRSAAASLGPRLNINRTLPAFPAPTTTGQIDLTDAATKAQYDSALKARQDLAKDIFDRLRFVATGAPPGTAIDKTTLPAAEYSALRWLAQLAVNIVDYRDSDDYITPFNWDTAAGDWVYGVELPRLVLNEVYSEVVNDPTDPAIAGMVAATLDYQVNFWAELHNPMMTKFGDADILTDPKDPTYDATRNAARLQIPDPTDATKVLYPIYKLTVAEPPAMGGLFTDTSLGTPDPANTKLDVAEFVKDPNKADPIVNKDLVLAADGAYKGADKSNQGFYLLGPGVDFPADPANTDAVPGATLRVKDQTIGGVRSAMTYSADKANAVPTKANLFLRRLACPNLKPQTDPTMPYYNPYVTVDYVQNVKINDGTAVNKDGVNLAPTATDYSARKAIGRKQPYAVHSSQQVEQSPDPNYTKQPQHTLFRHNAREAAAPPSAATAGQTLQVPFDWLVHMDRVLTNPMELLHVSSFAPYDLTQQFMTGTAANQRFTHRPLLDPTARIYRFLEFGETGQRAAGIASRIPGKININTIWDRETFRALVDFQAGLSSYATDDITGQKQVDALFHALVKSRTPGNGAQGIPLGMPGPDDRPFKGFGVGYVAAGDTQFPSGSGIDDTLLRADPNDTAANPQDKRRLLEVTPTQLTINGQPYQPDQPYLKNELLQKIFNNTTTRSNVFAVWITVGFFEVYDETADTNGNGVLDKNLLGAELGRAEGRHIRHRMFAIVDRSEMVAPALGTSGAAIAANPGADQPVTLNPGNAQGKWGLSTLAAPREVTFNWTLRAGQSVMIIDANDKDGSTQETVQLTAVDPATKTIKAVFKKGHAAGALILPPGIPGPVVNGGPSPYVYGNPGPQIGFDHRKNSATVLHFSVIQ